MSKETVFVCIRGMTRGSVWKVGGCMMVNSSTIRTSALQHFKCFYPKCALEVMLMAKTDNQLFILRHCLQMPLFIWPNLYTWYEFNIIHGQLFSAFFSLHQDWL